MDINASLKDKNLLNALEKESFLKSSKRATVVGDDIDFRSKLQISDASNFRKK